nr:MAG TPA: anaerobic ribonucleoside triphosphate reductase [Caudoviricetes sp.]
MNIPYAAAEAKGDKEKFFKILDEYCELAFDYHMIRVNRFKKTKARQNPILWMTGALAKLDPEETVEKTMYGGNMSLSLGYMGIAEAQDICHDRSKDFGIEIVKFLKEKCKEWTKRTNIEFSLYGTPGEVLCYTFAKAIKKDFPELNFDHDFVTNSFHVPVWENVDVFEKLDYESGFYMISSGGNVDNIEVPNLRNNKEALYKIICEAYNKINYLIVNQPVDQCFKCGYEGEFDCDENGFSCPVCGNDDGGSMCVIRRVSGYISEPDSRPFNKGKQEELICRQNNKHFGCIK